MSSFHTMIGMTQETQANLHDALTAWRKGDMGTVAEILRQVIIDCDDLMGQVYERYLILAAKEPSLRQQLPETEHFYRIAMERSKEIKEKGGDE